MKPAKIKSILRKKTQKIAELGAMIAPDFNEDILHRFRVKVKSLCAFIKLLNTTATENNFGIPRKMKKLYEISGIIRDGLLEQKQSTEPKLLLPSYTRHLNTTVENAKNNWKIEYSPNIFLKFEKKIEKYQPHNVNTKDFTAFFNTQVKTIQKISKDIMLTDSRIHNIRKRLKDINYNISIYTKYRKSGVSKLPNLPYKRMEDLADQIGEYNDLSCRLSRLVAFAQSGIPEKDLHVINVFYAEEIPYLFEQKKRILIYLKEILNLSLIV